MEKAKIDRINELGEMGVTSAIDRKPLSTETVAKIIYTNGINNKKAFSANP